MEANAPASTTAANFHPTVLNDGDTAAAHDVALQVIWYANQEKIKSSAAALLATGSKGAPTAQDFKNAAKTAKKKPKAKGKK